MKINDKWFKTIVWAGKVEQKECTNHSYAWSGKTPCTGMRVCIHCGKPE